MDYPLDKIDWHNYIEVNQERIGLLLTFRQVYEDLLSCVNLDQNETNFVTAYRKIILKE